MDPPKPSRDDLPTGTYALVIHEGGQDLHQRESPSPWEEPEWIEKRQYEHGEVPPLNLQQTQVEQRTKSDSLQTVILYAEQLTPSSSESSTDGDNKPDMAEEEGDGNEAHDEKQYRGHVISYSNGHVIPAHDRTIHRTQEQNMGEAVEFLVTDHGLIEEIEVPYFLPQARKNCIINDTPEHPDGSEMRGEYELPDGYYLHTALNERSKKGAIEHLANQVGLDVDFHGDWG